MSDDEFDPKEVLLKAQRVEKKELLAQIQVLKKSAPKGDKKKKKEVNDAIARLENDLEQKHKGELENFERINKVDQVESEEKSAGVEVPEVPEASEDENDRPLGPLPIKDGSDLRISKAQKRRDKKSAKDRQREDEIQKQEELNKLGPRFKEQQAIKEKLEGKKLKLKEIPSDGDCLFAGLEHQLRLLDLNSSVAELRSQAAEELELNPDQYSPFLSNTSTGDMLTSAEYSDYCEKMRNTPAWGGQVEIKALATRLKKPIQVIQGEGPDILVGEELKTDPLILTYHRHLHGLGEHYNSVTKS